MQQGTAEKHALSHLVHLSVFLYILLCVAHVNSSFEYGEALQNELQFNGVDSIAEEAMQAFKAKLRAFDSDTTQLHMQPNEGQCAYTWLGYVRGSIM